MVSVLPPHVVHDGRPAIASRLPQARAVHRDQRAARSADRRRRRPAVPRRTRTSSGPGSRPCSTPSACPDDALEAETPAPRRRGPARRSCSPAGGAADAVIRRGRTRDLADAVRAALDAHAVRDAPSIADDRRLAWTSAPTAAARAFRATFGLPPHEYVLGRRLEAARAPDPRRACRSPRSRRRPGSSDQAHLTRRFKRLVGITPGRYATSSPPLVG